MDAAAAVETGGGGAGAGAGTAPPPSKRQRQEHHATLCISCPDMSGVVAGVAQLLHGLGCNITRSDQHTDYDAEPSMYFQRLCFDYSGIHVSPGNIEQVFEKAMEELAQRYNMDWTISYESHVKKVAVMVSKEPHCLYDLLIRYRTGELPCEIKIIMSNHDILRPIAEMFGIPFQHLPIPPKDQGGKRAQELQVEAILEENEIDLVVMAKYMQILTKEFCDKFWRKTINIHHSALPSFSGARPYHRAHERGSKVIGATAHYATAELDAGPIIEQDVIRISHSDSISDMIRKGRDLERVVLARAVRWHLRSSIIIQGNKTVVFED